MISNYLIVLSVKELWWKELLVMEELEESRTVWSQVEELWCFVASLKLGFVETFCLIEALLCCGFLRGLVQNVSSAVVFGASKREQVPLFPLRSCLMCPHPLPPRLCFSQFCCCTPPQPPSWWTEFSAHLIDLSTALALMTAPKLHTRFEVSPWWISMMWTWRDHTWEKDKENLWSELPIWHSWLF